MAPPSRTPDKNTLQRWRDAGYTQDQMVEMTEKEFGNRVTRSAIANAMVRYGLSNNAPRYLEQVPWRINPTHATAHPLRMLRLLGRREQGSTLNARETDMLEAWLKQLKERKLIVGYDPEDAKGFHYISAKYKDHKGSTPIRKSPLQMSRV